MTTVEAVRDLALSLPRAYEALVRDQVKFRVGQIVFLALSRDETVMGCGFPKEERAAMVAAEPEKYALPSTSDLRYHWIHVRLDAIDDDEMHDLVVDAWRMCVPKGVARAYLDDASTG
ncbi:MAG: MmcQ/YjbR family DNA-binding protein [Actinomycetales bacterium]